MSARPWIMPMIAALGLAAYASDAPRVAIRWVDDPSGRTVAVEVAGLAPEGIGPSRAEETFTIRVEGSAPDQPAMLGTYRVVGDVLRFEPRFSFDRGRRYRATFRPEGAGPKVVSDHLIAKPAKPRTVVARVDPSGDRLPENLLKFYIHFSAPMGQGEALRHVRIRDDRGRAIERPFLVLGEELWDPSGKRLTLLLDPGRIKRGLVPREEEGPILEDGRSYSLEVDASWRDADGEPLGAPSRKPFAVGPADDVQPDPKTWTIAAPAASTRDALTIRFPEPLDRALLESSLTLVDARGEALPGLVSVEADALAWRFTPDAPWEAGDYRLLVEDDLEDLAGNNIRHPFEVDVTHPTTARREASLIRLAIPIRALGL